MEIILTRRWQGKHSTLGTLLVDGAAHHFVLEDQDRALDAGMALAEITAKKVPRKTAIPTGRYQVVITYSARFKRNLPLLVDVPGYAGIRIHPGNRDINTEGCLLPGIVWWAEDGDYVVGQSATACLKLQTAIAAALQRSEQVWLTIKTDYQR